MIRIDKAKFIVLNFYHDFYEQYIKKVIGICFNN